MRHGYLPGLATHLADVSKWGRRSAHCGMYAPEERLTDDEAKVDCGLCRRRIRKRDRRAALFRKAVKR